MRVAFTSHDGRMIDRHFGAAESFYIWEVGPSEATCIEKREPGPNVAGQEDKIVARAQMLEDCTIVYTTQIGGPAAAKLVGRHIQPMRTVTEVAIASVVERLQSVLRDRPPPWIRRALAKGKA
jgi:nitrogen fixation protein NifX